MAVVCPDCGRKGKTVKPITLRALLKDEFTAAVAVPDESKCQSGCTPSKGNTGWRFCDSPACDVVYFGEQNNQSFTRSQLKVAVGVKETTGERPLCYCFGHSVATIKDELRCKGRSDALDDIRRKMKSPGCRCETENPSGSCCLGSVTRGIEIAKKELDMTNPSSKNRGETIAKIGTVLSAIVASACCWLPLVLLVFGVSGAGIAGAMEAYRPLFIVLTLGFLAAAFYFTYRPRKSLDGKHDCCAVAKEEAKGRTSMIAVNKIMLWVVTLLAVVFLFFPKYMGFFLAWREPAANNPLVRTTTIAIEGMTCEGCSALVGKVVKDLPGVLSVTVDYARKRAVVGSEACCPAPTDAIMDALQQVGYRAAVIESDNAATNDTKVEASP